ncbi:putative phage abortive infection protein [bacterium SCSIO 12741]|nr:putative phage abortive infection protein [bacterium SCSIO 12741]
MKFDLNEEAGIYRVAKWSVLLITLTWVLTPFIIEYTVISRGTFGDLFGSINALYSGLALAGIILTILLQRLELKNQQEELQLTRKELKLTRQVFEDQSKTLRMQRFENTFFQMLSVHQEIVKDLDENKLEINLFNHADRKHVAINGRDVFKHHYKLLVGNLKSNERFNEIYLEYYTVVKGDFGHYFRTLYRIIKFIDETEFVSKQDLNITADPPTHTESKKLWVANFKIRYHYTSMVRALLSDYELLWLFYNGLSENGREKFKPLMDRYSLLKNMPLEELHAEGFESNYTKRALGKSD